MSSQRYHPYARPSVPAKSTASILSNAQGVAFNGNTTLHVNDSTSVSAEELLEIEGMKILCEKVASGAMHNSGERFDPPKCHPGTRVALQKDVIKWVDEPPSGPLVTWLFGPAGAGKSAIAQTISEKLHAEGKLTASFFFSRRESASKGRSEESALVATLAYQLSQNAPATESLIARAVGKNPLVFNLSLDDQVQALIIHPLIATFPEDSATHQEDSATHREDPEYRCPSVIVVDGLDECRKEDSAQSRVVSALINGISSIPQRSQKLFITSRPEHNIVAAFRSYKSGLVRKMELNDDWKPDDDIWRFLKAGFTEIRRSHPYFENHPADETWPCRTDISTLVSKSSGQFIYASVVLQYIKSDDYYDPAARLQVILQLINNEDEPYAELDVLYRYIFSQIPTRDVENVLIVLSLERACSHIKSVSFHGLGHFLPDLVDARIEETKFRFRPLVSILVWEGDMIRYMHASLPDFLIDPSRSNSFYINSLSIASEVVRRAAHLMKDKHRFMCHDLLLLLLRIPTHYTENLLPPEKTHIHSMLPNSSFLENVFDRMGNQPSGNFKIYDSAVGSYLEWILSESKSNYAPSERNTLARPLSKFQAWLLQQYNLVQEAFSRLYDANQIDLWPFLSLLNTDFLQRGDYRHIFDHIASALEICQPTSALQLSSKKPEDLQLSHQMVLLYCLLPRIPSWLASTDLLGKCAITGERYAVAFICTLRFLLRLSAPRFTLLLTEPVANNCDHKWSPTIRLARETFIALLNLIPLSINMSFLVLFVRTAVVGEDLPSSSTKEEIRRKYKGNKAILALQRYLKMTCKKFRVLNDPTSPEYIHAQANAEAAWVGFEKHPHDPVSLMPVLDIKQKRDRRLASQTPTKSSSSMPKAPRPHKPAKS